MSISLSNLCSIALMLQTATQQLRSRSASPRLDAEVLLGFVLGLSRTDLHMNPELELSTEQYEAFSMLIVRRAQGEPIAYLIGQREFWSLTLNVTPDVLIPRPETELL